MLTIVNSIRTRLTNQDQLVQLSHAASILKDDLIKELEIKIVKMELEKRYKR